MSKEQIISAQVIYPTADQKNSSGLHDGTFYKDPFKESPLVLEADLTEVQRQEAIKKALLFGHGDQVKARTHGLNITVGAANFTEVRELVVENVLPGNRIGAESVVRIISVRPSFDMIGDQARRTTIFSVVSNILK